MSDLKFCCEVAEKVLGFKRVPFANDEMNPGEYTVSDFGCGIYEDEIFKPDVDANDDLLVLRHVREKWDEKQQHAFAVAYMNFVFEESEPDEGFVGWEITADILFGYKVGFFSRAALAALDVL